MIKRLTALICALMLMLSLVACGNDNADQKADTTSSAETEEASAEAVFAKAFEADKAYDIDAMAEVEYSINFSKSIDKAERVKKTKQSIDELDEKTLEEYKESLKDATYTISESTKLTDEELKSRIAQLEPQYRDTDKITEIIKMIYEVHFPEDDDDDYNEDAVEMIKVDGKWYCYMGESTWGS